MPNPKDGTAGLIVAPAKPKKPNAADEADPGQVEEAKARDRQTQSGKYGSTPVTPYKPPETEEEKKVKTSWIEIELVDEEGQPIPGEAYAVTLPDQSLAEGTLDEKGFARIEGFPPGSCKITFPKLDQDAWEAS